MITLLGRLAHPLPLPNDKGEVKVFKKYLNMHIHQVKTSKIEIFFVKPICINFQEIKFLWFMIDRNGQYEMQAF